jgi:hypothetical protein
MKAPSNKAGLIKIKTIASAKFTTTTGRLRGQGVLKEAIEFKITYKTTKTGAT